MIFKRKIYEKLLKWKEETNGAKALFIEGARRIGKSTIAEEFAKAEYKSYMLIDFNDVSEVVTDAFHNYMQDLDTLFMILSTEYGKELYPGESLIIFDEIQQCSEAVTSLKYFEESERELYLICAGSLLGVELKKRAVSFPVGKIEHLTMFPMNFYEFTRAVGGKHFLDMLETMELYREIPSYITEPMLRYLKLYYIIGGMPEAVQCFSENKHFNEVREIQKRILTAYEQDFSKHAPNEIVPRLRECRTMI